MERNGPMTNVAETKVEMVNGIRVVTLPNDSLDASNSKDFKQEMEPHFHSGEKIVFDLCRVEFVDSSGCGALLTCLRNLNAAGGSLKLCGVSKTVRALFELLRMHRIFDIHETREQAMKAFDTP